MNLIHNERTKLFATALNNSAVATIVTAIVAPIVGFLYGSPNPAATAWWPLIGAAWLLVGLGLHVLDKSRLGDSRMTDLQMYLLIAPFVLLAIGASATFWWVKS